MYLTEREMDKLYVFMAGEVARKRREQGRRPLGRALGGRTQTPTPRRTD